MTTRQEQLLRTIVEYYVQTAAPVGSQALAQQFGVSSATVRAEMSHLEELGYITHPHTSAGRIPTDAGYRLYVERMLMPQSKIDATHRVRQAIAQRIASAGSPQAAVRVAVDSLVHVTHNVAFATLGEAVHIKGFAQLFRQPEFSEDVDDIAGLLDNLELWLREMQPEKAANAYIGEENAVGKSSGCAIIVAGYDSEEYGRDYVGVIGSTRQNYNAIMHIIEHTAQELEEVLHG